MLMLTFVPFAVMIVSQAAGPLPIAFTMATMIWAAWFQLTRAAAMRRRLACAFGATAMAFLIDAAASAPRRTWAITSAVVTLVVCSVVARLPTT